MFFGKSDHELWLEAEVLSLRKQLTDLRHEYDAKIEAERTRSRVQEQMFLDRLMAQAGVPQMYNTVQTTDDPEPETQGYAPGIASVLSMQQFEDGLFQKELLEQAKALAEAQQQESSFAVSE